MGKDSALYKFPSVAQMITSPTKPIKINNLYGDEEEDDDKDNRAVIMEN